MQEGNTFRRAIAPDRRASRSHKVRLLNLVVLNGDTLSDIIQKTCQGEDEVDWNHLLAHISGTVDLKLLPNRYGDRKPYITRSTQCAHLAYRWGENDIHGNRKAQKT